METACPKCGGTLVDRERGAHWWWTCPTGHGEAVSYQTLRSHLGSKRFQETWRYLRRPGPLGNRKCPQCRDAMERVRLPAKDRRVSVDTCRSCGLVWFDTNELTQTVGALEHAGRGRRYKAGLGLGETILATVGVPAELNEPERRVRPVVSWAVLGGMLLGTVVALVHGGPVLGAPGQVFLEPGFYTALAAVLSAFLDHRFYLVLVYSIVFLRMADNVEDLLGHTVFAGMLALATALGWGLQALGVVPSGVAPLGLTEATVSVVMVYTIRFPHVRFGWLSREEHPRWFRPILDWFILESRAIAPPYIVIAGLGGALSGGVWTGVGRVLIGMVVGTATWWLLGRGRFSHHLEG